MLGCVSIDYACSCKDVIALVQRINESRGITNYVSGGNLFANLTLRASVPLSQARAKARDPEVLDQYFDLMESKTMI